MKTITRYSSMLVGIVALALSGVVAPRADAVTVRAPEDAQPLSSERIAMAGLPSGATGRFAYSVLGQAVTTVTKTFSTVASALPSPSNSNANVRPGDLVTF